VSGEGHFAVRRWLELPVVLLLFALVLGASLGLRGCRPSQHHVGGAPDTLSWDLADWNNHYWTMWDSRRFFRGEGSPLRTASEFHPTGLDTLHVHGDLLLKLIAGLASLVAPPDLVYRLLVLVVFLGNGIGGFLLVRSMTGSRVAGGVSGLLFCFCGAVAWSVNSGNLENGLWLWSCLYLLFFHRLLRRGRWLDVLGAAAFFMLATLGNFTFAYHLAMLSAVLFAFELPSLDRRRLLAALGFALAVGAMALPLALSFSTASEPVEESPVVQAARSGWIDREAATSPQIGCSTTPWEFLPWNRGEVPRNTPPGRGDVGGEDSDTYYVVWLLLALSVVVAPRRALPWAAAGGLFIVLALGPFASWTASGGETGWRLPFYFAHRFLPLYHFVHFPHRIAAFAVLSFGVAIGFAVAWLIRRSEGPFEVRTTGVGRVMLGGERMRALAGSLLLAAVLIELLCCWTVRPTARLPVNGFYEDLAQQDGAIAVVEFPLDYGLFDSRYLFFQTRHGKPLFNGTLPRYLGERATPPNVELLTNNAFLRTAYEVQVGGLPRQVAESLLPLPGDPPPSTPSAAADAVEALREVGFGYVIVHRRLAWTADIEWVLPADNELMGYVRSVLGDPAYDDAELAAFDLLRATERADER